MLRENGTPYSTETLKAHVDRFSEARILVIGDLIMDEYVWGDVSRISPEAPVPVVEVRQETKMLGGAANVVANIASLGGRPILCGVVGQDATGQELVGRVEALGVTDGGILVDPERPTSIKTRVVAHNQQVVRFDRESRRDIGPQNRKRLLDSIARRLKDLQAVIVADYGKGVISSPLMKGLREVVADSGVIVAVDPKTENYRYYRGIDVITPNHHEAGSCCGIKIVDQESLIRAGRRMLQDLRCRSVLITQGKDGMTLFERGGEINHIPTVARKVYDVTGAGDTVIGTFCLALAVGMDHRSAAILSNFAAGIVVGEVGTTTVGAEDLKRAVDAR
jgi:D-beta-D-heptose 7-phosphate kinase/D-beta-D-heptose 1-phosphate adenosyltransferase